MSPLELIKEGVLTGNMEQIARGYAMMTGEQIEPSQISESLEEDSQGSTPPINSEIPPSSDSTISSEDELLEEDLEQNSSLEELLEDEDVTETEQVVENPNLFLPKKKLVHKLIVPASFSGSVESLDNDEDNSPKEQQCTRTAFQIKKRENKFKDNLTYAKEDITFDNKVRSSASKDAHKYIQKRPPDKGVVVTCRECNRRFRIQTALAPQKLTGNDKTSYQCDKCILNKKR